MKKPKVEAKLLQAIWVDCPGVVSDGIYLHSLRDFCTTCAPWWEKIPICPNCKVKMMKSGKNTCKKCGEKVMVDQNAKK